MDSVKLLTYNVWGLKYISKYRQERIEGIVTKLLDPSEHYDIIALQEVWCEQDWQLFHDKLHGLYPYTRYFKAGIIAGPGLAILSKIPINETFLYRFPINGRPSAVNRGDWFVGKSISITMLMNNIVVLNSHMHAPYSLEGDNAYTCHRSCQAWDITKIIKLLNKAGYHVILVGDLNSKPNSLPYKLFTIEAGLQDSWNRFKLDNNESILTQEQLSQMTPKDQITLGAVTCDSQLNSWRCNRRLDEACRLDYALINQSLSVIDASVKFIDRLPQYDCSYSDHFGYYAHLKLNGGVNQSQSNHQLNEVLNHQIYSELLAEINDYQQNGLPRHHMWRVYHFGGTIIVSIGLVVIGFIFEVLFMLIMMLVVLGPGIINGIILLNYLYEQRNLEEVKMEVENAMESCGR